MALLQCVFDSWMFKTFNQLIEIKYGACIFEVSKFEQQYKQFYLRQGVEKGVFNMRRVCSFVIG